jgi:hypothetical protein
LIEVSSFTFHPPMMFPTIPPGEPPLVRSWMA